MFARRIATAGSRNFSRGFSSHSNAPVIVAANRTPIGSFQSSLKSLQGHELGTIVIKDLLQRSGVSGDAVDEVLLGNVIQAAQGQAPARQAALRAGVTFRAPCTTVNKVCASGMKTVMMASQLVSLGQAECVVSGGFESMSNIPFFLPNVRGGLGLGHGKVLDGILADGLWDAFDDHHMGMAAEHCANEYGITRADQDAFALESYRRAQEAAKAGAFKDEIVPVEVSVRGKPAGVVSEDEEIFKLKADKVPTLRPAFKKDGTVTAANASKINDGAASLLIVSPSFAANHNLKPLARILGYGDAGQAPIDFTTTPSKAIPVALSRAGLSIGDIDLWELNQAFSVVSLANMKILGLDASKVDVYGGAVALGHPIGCSGARIITTLVHALARENKQYGAAAICNGGGGASAIVIERA